MSKAWREANRTHLRAESTRWKREHPEAVARTGKASYDRRQPVIIQRKREAYMADPEHYRAIKRASSDRATLRRLGITAEEEAAVLAAQGGVCAICKRPEPGTKFGKWCRDHDHETGRFRGLLCNWCNQALGRFEDDPARLASAIEYLQRSAE